MEPCAGVPAPQNPQPQKTHNPRKSQLLKQHATRGPCRRYHRCHCCCSGASLPPRSACLPPNATTPFMQLAGSCHRKQSHSPCWQVGPRSDASLASGAPHSRPHFGHFLALGQQPGPRRPVDSAVNAPAAQHSLVRCRGQHEEAPVAKWDMAALAWAVVVAVNVQLIVDAFMLVS